MTTHPLILLLATLSLLCVATPPCAQAAPLVTLHSNQLIKGEDTVLTIDFPGDAPLTPPSVRGDLKLSITALPNGQYYGPQRTLTYRYSYRITGNEIGTHRIPPIDYTLNNKNYTLPALPVQIFGHDSLTWLSSEIYGNTLHYAVALLVPKKELYSGETLPATVKLILPSQIPLVDYNIPDLEQSNLSAWRFEPDRKHRGSITLSSRPHHTYTYQSTISPLDTGPAQLGPGTIRPVFRFTTNQGGATVYRSLPVKLDLPKLVLLSKALPSPAPAGFNGAIGDFTLSATVENPRATPGTPLTVILNINGTGNLDNLHAPQLTEPDGWKIFDPAKHTRDEERRRASGEVKFTQILRSQKSQTSIPPFQLVTFNPSTNRYQTLRTSPIPILAASPNPLDTALNDYDRDILGLIDPSQQPDDASLIRNPTLQKIHRHWHLIPLGLLVILALILLKRKILPRLQPTQKETDLASTLSHLRQLDGTLFLREVGHFIETRIPRDRHDEFTKSLLTQRDKNCYTADPNPAKIDPTEKNHILTTLKAKAT